MSSTLQSWQQSLPPSLRRMLTDGRKRLVIDLLPKTIVAVDMRRPAARIEIARERIEQDAPALQRLASRPFDEIVLRLGGDQVLVKDLKLPLSARGRLAEIVPFELQRVTPFPADQMVHDQAIVGRDASGLSVRVQVATKAAIDQAVASLAALRIPFDRVLGGAGDPDFADLDRFDTLRAQPAAQRSSRNTVLWVLATAAVLAAVASPFIRLDAERRSLQQLVAAAEARVPANAPANDAADRARRAVQMKAATPPVVVVLDALTKALPDDAWLVQFNWADRQLEIEGVARSAASLVQRLEAIPLFGRVTFLTPVTRDPVNGNERFHFGIAMTVEPRPR